MSLANDEAARLLTLPAELEGRPVTELGLDPSISDLLASGRLARDELHVVADRVVAVNQTPATQGNRIVGTVTTLRDHTELRPSPASSTRSADSPTRCAPPPTSPRTGCTRSSR